MNKRTKMTICALVFGTTVAGAGEANAWDEQAEPIDYNNVFKYVFINGTLGDYAIKNKENGVFREHDVSDPYHFLELKVPDDNGKEESLLLGTSLGYAGRSSYLSLDLSDGVRFVDYGANGIAERIRVSIDSPIEIPTPEQQRVYQEKVNRVLKYINKNQ